MNKYFTILAPAMMCMGCSSDDATKQTNDGFKKPHEISSQLTVSTSSSPGYFHIYRDAQNRLLPFNDTVTNNVAIVGLYPYHDSDNKTYYDLRSVETHNQFEPILYQDTLYLKFFRRHFTTEQGVRVKVVNDRFSISYYSTMDVESVFIYKSIQPYSEVEDYVDSAVVANRQMLRLGRSTYKVGDTISGDIAYEGRIYYETKPPMSSSVLAKGSFKGIVKEGRPFTLTKPKS